MLASTVQFSTYNQTPVTRPHQTHAHPQETQRYEEQTGPEQDRDHPHRDGPLSQDPTACLRTRPSPAPRVPHPEGPYYQQQTMPAELVSVPPSSTTPQACSPPRLRG